jgi:hypothetical protein
MSKWFTTIKIKHLLTESENHVDVQRSMAAIADILDAAQTFSAFPWKRRFRNIPKGDDIVSPADYANKLLDKLYDFADERRIWIA